MIFHIVLNSLLVFFILSISVELALFLFRIEHPRIRYFCRSLPILKIPFDFFVFGFFGYNLWLNYNPFSCEVETKEILMQYLPERFHPELTASQHFVIPEYIAMQLPSYLLQFIIIGVVVISTAAFSMKLFQFIGSKRYLTKLIQLSKLCDRSITNKSLQEALNKYGARILISEQVPIPCAAAISNILFPKQLAEELSQEEFEAVVAHELEHLRWKDPLFKMLNASICALFWWIPASWLIKRLEMDQEQASDATMHKYHIDNHALASALVLSAQKAKFLEYQLAAICPLNSPKSTNMHRLEKILEEPKPNSMDICDALAVIVCAVVFMSFWMC